MRWGPGHLGETGWTQSHVCGLEKWARALPVCHGFKRQHGSGWQEKTRLGVGGTAERCQDFSFTWTELETAERGRSPGSRILAPSLGMLHGGCSQITRDLPRERLRVAHAGVGEGAGAEVIQARRWCRCGRKGRWEQRG